MENVRKMAKSARSVTYSPDGRALAIGFKDGKSDCLWTFKLLENCPASKCVPQYNVLFHS